MPGPRPETGAAGRSNRGYKLINSILPARLSRVFADCREPILLNRLCRLVLVTAMGSCAGAHAAERSPLDSQEPVPALRYRSVFDGYTGLQETVAQDWRAANETVGRVGGWRAYSRESDLTNTPAVPASGPHHPTPASPAGRQP